LRPKPSLKKERAKNKIRYYPEKYWVQLPSPAPSFEDEALYELEEQTRELRTISRQIDAEQWNRFWRENRGRKLQSFGYGWIEVK
jgi:hypothetical protein